MKFYSCLSKGKTGRKMSFFPLAYVGSRTLTRGSKPSKGTGHGHPHPWQCPQHSLCWEPDTLAAAEKLLWNWSLETAEREKDCHTWEQPSLDPVHSLSLITPFMGSPLFRRNSNHSPLMITCALHRVQISAETSVSSLGPFHLEGKNASTKATFSPWEKALVC